MKIATIIPLQKGIFKENLTYFTAKDISPGDIVEVAVRNRKILGLVISADDAEGQKSDIKHLDFNLKKITEIKKESIFRKEFFEALFSLSDYSIQNKSILASILIPEILREQYDEIVKFKIHKILKHNESNIKAEKAVLQTNLEDRISYYKTLIRSAFAEKKSIFFILPTENDITEFAALLGKGIEQFTVQLHSNFTKKKILEKIKLTIESPHPLLILATPMFLSIPRYDIHTIIVELESSSSYKNFNKQSVDYRIFIELFAYSTGIRLIFGDTLLRLETLQRVKINELGEIRPVTFRLNWEGKVEINDTQILAKKDQKFKIFSDESIAEIEHILSKKEKVFIFTLRKGLATYTMCRDCSQILFCKQCHAPVVLYLSKDKTKRMFVCNRCGENKDPNTICAFCGSWNLFPLGIGTDTAYEELENILAKHKVKILQLDKDKVKNKKEAEKIIEEFMENDHTVLLGTEMALFYLNQKVHTSIVASFDALWSIPNFKMGEKILHILLKILAKTEKKIIIQTKNTEDSAVLAIQNQNVNVFVNEELKDREELGFPPYKRFIKISYYGDKEQIKEARNFLEKNFEKYEPEIFSGFVNKIKGQYVINALIKLNPQKWSLPMLSPGSSIDQDLSQLLFNISRDFDISIDPEDLS